MKSIICWRYTKFEVYPIFSSIKYIYIFSFRLGIVYVNQNYCDHSLGDEIPWDVLVRIRLFIPSKGNCIMQRYFLDQRHVNLLFGAGIGSYYKGFEFSIEVIFINSTFLSCTHILPERNRFYISNKSISTESDFIVILFFDSFYIFWVTSYFVGECVFQYVTHWWSIKLKSINVLIIVFLFGKVCFSDVL